MCACGPQVAVAQVGTRTLVGRWIKRYKRRMDQKMLSIGDGEEPATMAVLRRGC